MTQTMDTERRFDPLGGLRPRVAAFIAAVAAAGAGVVAAGALQWHDESLALLATLAGFAVFAERFDIRLFKHSRVSVSAVPILAAGMIAGLPGIMVVALAAALGDYIGRDKPHYKGVFNAGALLVSGAAYVGVFQAFPVGNDSGEWPALLFPALVGVLANFIVNSVLVAFVIALDTGERFLSLWDDNFRSLPPHYVVFGVLAAMMASAYHLDGLDTLAVVFAPVVMMRYIVKQAMERTTEMLERLKEGAVEAGRVRSPRHP